MTEILVNISHHVIQAAVSATPISFKDLTTYLSLTRILIPWVTGFPYMAFLVWHYLREEINALLTQGQRIGLFDWDGSDSAYLNYLVLVAGSFPSFVYLSTYLLGLPASLYYLWATSQASLDTSKEEAEGLAKILLIISSIVYTILGGLSLGGIAYLLL